MNTPPKGRGKHVVYCSGTNRLGQPCLSRVANPGDRCGQCAGPVTDPYPLPDSAATTDAGTHDGWTAAATLAPKLESYGQQNEELQRLIDIGLRLAESSRAATTRAAYQKHWETFEAFRDAYDIDALFPAPAEHVALFIAYLTDRGRLRTDGRGDQGDPLSTSYVAQAVAAIGRRHTMAGHPNPTDTREVRDVLNGYAQWFGTHQDGKDPLRLPQIATIVHTLSAEHPLAARDRALCLLASHPDLAINAGQLARLTGEHIILDDNLGEPAILLISSGRSIHLDAVEVPVDPNPAACPSAALRALKPDRWGPVFRSAHGNQLSRQAVRHIIDTVIERSGVEPIERRAGLPILDQDGRAALTERTSAASRPDTRNRAMLLVAYWGAFRGSEISQLVWRNVRFVDNGLEVHVTRAKNDQKGKGHTTGLPRHPDPFLCPRVAVEEWRATQTLILGREPSPNDPVFTGFTRTDTPAITRETISNAFKTAASRAGLDGDFGSHSPRIGFACDALDAGIDAQLVARQGRWANVHSIDSYYKKTLPWGAGNAAQHLIERDEG